MTKTSTYFSHDAGARNDSRILRLRMTHGAAGYGIYFMLLERMREEEDYMLPCDYAVLSYDFHEPEDLIRSVVEDFGLFEISDIDGDRKFWSASFKRRMDKVDEVSRKRAAAVAKRSDRTSRPTKVLQNPTIVEQTNSFVEQPPGFVPEIKGKESKIKKSKEKENKEKSPVGDDEEKTPPPPTEKLLIFDLADAVNTWKNDNEWLAAVAEVSEVNIGILPAVIDKFAAYCRANGKRHTDDADARSHLARWMVTDAGRKFIARIRATAPRAPVSSSPAPERKTLHGKELEEYFGVQPGETLMQAMARHREKSKTPKLNLPHDDTT